MSPSTGDPNTWINVVESGDIWFLNPTNNNIKHMPAALENGLDQLIGTLNKLSIYPSVHKELIQTIFEAHIVYNATKI